MSIRDRAAHEYTRYTFKRKIIFDWYIMSYREVMIADLGKPNPVEPEYAGEEPIQPTRAHRKAYYAGRPRSKDGQKIENLMRDGTARTTLDIAEETGITPDRVRELIRSNYRINKTGTARVKTGQRTNLYQFEGTSTE